MVTAWLMGWLISASLAALAGGTSLSLHGGPVPRLREIHHERLHVPIQSDQAVDLAPGSDLAAIATLNEVRVWRLDTNQVIKVFAFGKQRAAVRKEMGTAEPLHVGFSPNGTTLAISYMSRIYLYDVATWRQVGSLGVEGEDTPRRPAVPTDEPIRRPTLSGSPFPTAQDRQELRRYKREMDERYDRTKKAGDGRTRVAGFTFTPDGAKLLAGYARGECFVWFHWGEPSLWPSGNDPVRLWEVNTGRVLWERVYDPETVMRGFLLSPNGKWFAAQACGDHGNHYVVVHELQTGQRLYSLPMALGASAVIFTPNSQQLITNPSDEMGCLATVRLHLDHPDDPWRQQLTPADEACQKLGGRQCDSLALYDVATGKQVGKLTDDETTFAAGLSPDGRWLAAGQWSNRYTFRIWDMQTHRPVGRYTPSGWAWLSGTADLLRFQPNGRRLVVVNTAKGLLAVYEVVP
jgi:WD40 repeat protein